MDESEAVDALKRLDLSTYEARVFVALQKLGVGSASEVSEIADVPRSQVYGAADSLEARGLVDVQQGTPTRYRPIGLTEAKRLLVEQLEAEADSAFDYLEDVRGQFTVGGERSEAIWLVHGRENVLARAVELVDGAEHRVVYGAPDADLLEPALADALREKAAAGVDVTVASTEPAFLAAFEDVGAVTTHELPELPVADVRNGRTLLVDDDKVLLTVLPAESLPHISQETAFWSDGTAFATMLVTFIGQGLESLFEAFDGGE